MRIVSKCQEGNKVSPLNEDALYQLKDFLIANDFNESLRITPFLYKKGNKIHIKKQNRGKFTEYCGGTVTSECIARGKRSPNPTIRKRATFAANARKWKHRLGGLLVQELNLRKMLNKLM